MNELIDQIKTLSGTYFNEIVKIRRHIHAHPELSFDEHKTAALVAEFLTKSNIEHETGVAKTGVVALIKGKKGGKKTIALRADMDALPIMELNDLPYKSKHPGVMHACGHDLHTSSLLGAAKILSAMSKDLNGNVKLIFQPSEEKYPGGAKVMIEKGFLKTPSRLPYSGSMFFRSWKWEKLDLKPANTWLQPMRSTSL